MDSKLEFGTGGIRGVMGDGDNRINHQTIKHVTHGLAKTILSHDAPKSVGVAYDTRHNSAGFARTVCEVLSAFGIETYSFDKPMPTPMLSHAIRLNNLGWGVVITASHNPQEYNGYKVYDRHGVQITDKTAAAILASINSLSTSEPIPKTQNDSIHYFSKETEEKFINQIIAYISSPFSPLPSSFPFIYSALHGTGAYAIPKVLNKLGFSPICIQQNPDGTFGGLKTPNPEEPAVYENALKEAERTGAELILATDPDCDRVGVMVKTKQGFKLLNGNQIGALLIDFLAQAGGISTGDKNCVSNVVISTIVSGLLGELISKDHNLEFIRLLTGFKYIGEHIVNLSEDKHFFFGYEESYGFLAGDGARDKDAVIASALIVKMAEYYENKGQTLFDRLLELSEKHGYCLESLTSPEIPQDRQKEIMNRLRTGISIEGLIKTEDYLPGINGLPPADVLKMYLELPGEEPPVKAWAAIRPSGTEPKLKLYTGVHAKTEESAKEALKSLTKKLLDLLEILFTGRNYVIRFRS